LITGSSGDYTRWLAWLEDFGRGVDHDQSGLPDFDTAWGEGMYGRLLERVEQAFVARMELWDRQLIADLDAGDLSADRLGAVLAAARRRLLPLRRFAASPRFPDDLRKPLQEALRQSVDSAQRSLERSAAQSDRTGLAASLIRRGTLLADIDRPPDPSPPPSAPPVDGPPTRRILFH
jgi:hypothetical protein